MSELRLTTSDPVSAPPPPAGVKWIDLEAAARRSGKSLGHLSRLCRQSWRARGVAREVKPEGGGKARWLVREDADASLAAVQFPHQMTAGADLRSHPEAKRHQAARRLEVLRLWGEARKGGFTLGFTEQQVTAQFCQRMELDRGIRVSRRTLYGWERLYRKGGLAALIDGRGGKLGDDDPADADPFLDEVRRLYLSLRRPSLALCHEVASLKAAEQGWTVRSYKAAQRHLEKVPPAVVRKLRLGDEAYTNDAQPWIERDYSTLRSNEVWCGDHHQCDVIVNAGTIAAPRLVRPWITAWEDCRSRKIVGWRVFDHDPNQDTILLAFRDAVLEHGVPEHVYIDNGKDYDCYALNGRTKKDRWAKRTVKVSIDAAGVGGLFGELGVSVTHCEPYHGQSKPIERWFRTLEERYCVSYDTYCGSSPGKKPEDLQQHLERGHAPLLTDFAASLALWVRDGYHARPHAGDSMDGRTPDAVFAACLETKRTARADLLDLLLQKRTQPVKVTQNGVTWEGLRYGQHAPELHALLGEEVFLRVDPDDVSRVTVWQIDGRFVCRAQANTRVPFFADAQDLRAAQQEKRRHRKLTREYVEARPRLHEDLTDRVIRSAAARARERRANDPDQPPPGPTLQPVRSPLENQLPALRRAIEADALAGRKAVGAESLRLCDVDALISQDPTSRESPQPPRNTLADLRAAFQFEDDPPP